MSAAGDTDSLSELLHLAGALSPAVDMGCLRCDLLQSYVPRKGQPMASDSMVECGTHSVLVFTLQNSPWNQAEAALSCHIFA